MIEICSRMTKSEKQKFVNDMKKKLEEMEKEKEEEEEDDDEQYERTNLDKFDLFQKKNYYIHILSKKICDILFSSTSVRAYVYGGFIRDNILHDYMAKQFYDRTLFNDHELFEKYNDPKVDSETSFRTLVPKDIDMRFFSEIDYRIFLERVKSEGYHVHAYAVSGDKYKTPKKNHDNSDEEDKEENIVKYKVEVKSNIPLQDLYISNARLLDKEYATTSVIVDVTISEKRNCADFLCNSVQMSRHGFSIHSERNFFGSVKDLIMEQKHEMEMMGLIEDQIHTMEAAVLCCSHHISIPDRHRMMKMVKKGWKIKIIAIRELSFLTQITAEDDDEELCIICHEKFETISVVPGVHTLLDGVKFSCCSASYHCHCLVELLKKNTHTILSRDKNNVTYKCVQCSQQKMSFYTKNMIEFLEELEIVFDLLLTE